MHADNAADQDDQRQPAVVRARAPRAAPRSETASRHPCGGSPASRALRGRLHQRLRVVELRHQAVDMRRHQLLRTSSSTFASGSIVRISKIEIIGRKRMNRNSSARNSPIVPTNVAQSQNVGAVHAPGRRQEVAVQAGDDDHEPLEPHADVDDDRDDEQRRHARAHALEPEHLRRQRCCRRSAPSTASAYGPVIRLIGTNPSYWSPLYQAMNASIT